MPSPPAGKFRPDFNKSSVHPDATHLAGRFKLFEGGPLASEPSPNLLIRALISVASEWLG
jgi:hypothetical protein